MGRLFVVNLERKAYNCKHCKTHLALCDDIVSKVHHGSLYVNDVEQQEKFIVERPSYTSDLKYVPNGHVYVLGDNRNNNYDSHNWGPLPVENIVGRYVMCCYRPSNHKHAASSHGVVFFGDLVVSSFQ